MAVICERYADALLELASDTQTLTEYLDEIKLLDGLLDENPELSALFVNPKITAEEKEQVIKNCFEGKFAGDIVGLLMLVIRNGRAGELKGIIDCFITAAKKKLGIAVVYVESAASLSETIKRQLEAKLIATTGCRSLEMHYAVKKDLIGGVRVQMGDRILDNTVKTKIGILSKELRDNK
ncbi:MAG: ATP synthase F1 subunit delta [Lachnospiraceae bacterium]|nr:ATP synthase F1 subunit delta [Lachnospiraceae bacterium]